MLNVESDPKLGTILGASSYKSATCGRAAGGEIIEAMMHIRRIEVPIPTPARWVNCYYIEDSAPTLIDTGVNSDEGMDTIGAALADSGRGFTDLSRIIITHGHMDHAGLAGGLADMSRADLFIHPWEVDTATGPGAELRQRVRVFGEFLLEAGVPDAARAELMELVALRYQS